MKLSREHDHKLPTGALGLAITADGGRAFAACADGGVYVVDVATGKAEIFEEKHSLYASGCVLLPDGRTVISGGYDGQLLWHDVETRRCVRKVKAHEFWSWQLALSPDGKRVASVTGQYLPGGWKYEPASEVEASVKVFDTASGDLAASFPHVPPALSCAFSPDGKQLAAGNMMGEVRVWNLDSPKETKPVSQWKTGDFTSWGTIKTHHYCGGIYALAFSPDGSALVGCGMGPMTDPMAGNGKMTWQRWDWRKGERIDQIKDDSRGAGLMEALAWNSDGKYFVMAGKQAQGNWNLAVVSASDGGLAHSVDAKNRITQARFSADGKALIVSAANGQPAPKSGEWPAWGRLQVYRVES